MKSKYVLFVLVLLTGSMAAQTSAPVVSTFTNATVPQGSNRLAGDGMGPYFHSSCDYSYISSNTYLFAPGYLCGPRHTVLDLSQAVVAPTSCEGGILDLCGSNMVKMVFSFGPVVPVPFKDKKVDTSIFILNRDNFVAYKLTFESGIVGTNIAPGVTRIASGQGAVAKLFRLEKSGKFTELASYKLPFEITIETDSSQQQRTARTLSR